MAHYNLDVTKDHCPMTFVRTKIQLSKLAFGDVLNVLVTDGEPLENIPRSSAEQGFNVLSIVETDQKGIHLISIKKMIQIPKSIIDGIVLQARAEFPNEACGLLAGKVDRAQMRFGMTNADASPEHFSFLPSEQFKVLRAARAEGLDIIANYHSHPATPARPSEEDIKLAYDPNILYLIVSLAEKLPVLKAFRIRAGVVEQINIESF